MPDQKLHSTATYSLSSISWVCGFQLLLDKEFIFIASENPWQTKPNWKNGSWALHQLPDGVVAAVKDQDVAVKDQDAASPLNPQFKLTLQSQLFQPPQLMDMNKFHKQVEPLLEQILFNEIFIFEHKT